MDVDAVLAWFDAHARDLPWRRPEAGAWGVLVSEIMLAQTPVSRVVPAWREWLERWPTPAALSAEEPAEAIRAWGRLGYPRRALRLHECARVLVERHDGEVPSDVDELLALPGLGEYAARAVAAFAFGARTPVVDVNVRRLVARAVHGAADGGPATSRADLRSVAALLPEEAGRAARLSAALMELGALVCTARRPACEACPIRAGCAWLAAGAPPATGPARRPQRYAGTDRQVRGLLLAVLREATGPVPATRLDLVWPAAAQRDRALATLVADGLVRPVGAGHYALPTGAAPDATPPARRREGTPTRDTAG
jgi:A/G-specific adenine glycosylase